MLVLLLELADSPLVHEEGPGGIDLNLSLESSQTLVVDVDTRSKHALPQ